jgi:uncharacterized protein YkwD
MVRFLAVCLLVLLSVPDAGAGTNTQLRVDAKLAAEALTRINFYRAQHGAPALNMEARLAVMARDHARDMVRRDYVDIRSPVGDTLETRLRDARYPYRKVAQQVAVGPPTGKQLVDHWMTRPESRRLILNRDWREAGIGYAANQNGDARPRNAMDHYWVLTVAAPTQRADRRWRREILERVNRFRAQYRLAPLSLNERLNRAAQSHADDMAARDYFAHASPDGETVGERAARAGYKWRAILENLAAGQDSPRETVEGWIRSPGHRKAMLDPTVKDAGVGYRFLSGDGGRTRQFHYWALNMALAR